MFMLFLEGPCHEIQDDRQGGKPAAQRGPWLRHGCKLQDQAGNLHEDGFGRGRSGFGAKDYRVIFVFANDEAFTKFLDSGWTGSGQADAAAKVGKSGEAYPGAAEVAPGV